MAFSNQTIKKADGTTDIVYEAYVPSSGDGSASVYREQPSNSTALASELATVKVTASPNGAGTARRVIVDFRRNVVSKDTSNVGTILGSTPGRFELLLPSQLPLGEHAESAEQFVNFLASAQVRAAIRTAMAPR